MELEPVPLPSDDVPDLEKRAFSEADVHSTLFEPDMQELGFPSRTSSQADGLFLLGYLNSALATYFLERIVNTTATADVGYIEKLPYRRPTAAVEADVVELVERIIETLQRDPEAEIDRAILDLFEIRASREEVLRFYRTAGRVEREPRAAIE